MNTSFTPNGNAALNIADTDFIAQQMDWLAQIIDARLRLFFNQEPEIKSLEDLAPPSHVWYDGFAGNGSLSWQDKALLWLSLSPILRPQLLDSFFVKNQDLDQRFTELGGHKASQYGGLLPTLDTLLFILAGEDTQQRIFYLNHFSRGHILFSKALIELESPGHAEPYTASVLVASRDLIELVLRGTEYAPDFSQHFPAQKLTTAQAWEELILEPDTLEQIEEIKTFISLGNKMLDDYNLRTKIKPGFRSLFVGPPGTGKTFTAALLGKYTGYDVYRIDLSLVISKYIGETEKNLTRIFDRAESKRWILFFDEADALFGKRTQVKDSHDRYANQEVSYLLQRVEDFNGLIILATNLKANIDDAFARRFQSIIDFYMPKPAERLKIWSNTFSKQTKFSPEIDLTNISRSYELSGGSITNVVRYCSLQAIKRGNHIIENKDILEGIRKEFSKEGKTV